MSISQLTPAERKDVITDLLNLSTPLEKIVDKYHVSPDTIYQVARRAGFNMSLRTRLMKMISQRRELDRKIHIDTQKLWDSVNAGN